MNRLRVWSTAVGLALSTLVLVVVGCGRTAPQPSAEVEKPSAEPSSAASGGDNAALHGAEVTGGDRGSAVLLADWTRDDPDFVGALILSGQMLGYHEPCGCAAKQKGGLVRRAVIVERLRRQGWKLALADLGSLAGDPYRDRGGPDQVRIRLTHTLRALGELGYSAVGLSADDLRLGTTETLLQIDNTLSAAGAGLVFVSANAIPAEGFELEKTLRPAVRAEVGPRRLGITSVLDPSAFAALKDPDKESMLTVIDPAEALGPVLAELEADTDTQVLLVQGPVEMARELAERFAGFEIVVSTSDTSDAPAEPELLNEGRTRLIQVGTKGMYLGVVGLSKDPAHPPRYRRLEINDRYDRDRELAGRVRTILGDELQAAYRNANTLASYPRRPYADFTTPPGATYVGVETCRSCHPKTVAKWESTKHAHAYEPLIRDPRDEGRNREHDASCVSCHTTGFEYHGGFVTLAETPFLKGNQCENCHGPGSKHASDPANAEWRAAMARSRDDFERNRRCVRCHDEDNDPKFNFATYWPQIMHNDLDTYDDPRVRTGAAVGESAGGEPGSGER
ncbi:MAG: hypothetical protein KatS3mg108_3363 [Isosphaeraceae bacterium]|jgi:hypothetical protein|nr:MAG: hypothetical protein KatS3mg108_3363 [Isosphaeraceae bacterium]